MDAQFLHYVLRSQGREYSVCVLDLLPVQFLVYRIILNWEKERARERETEKDKEGGRDGGCRE
jgi:hypothetical protein